MMMMMMMIVMMMITIITKIRNMYANIYRRFRKQIMSKKKPRRF
jgi:hypothetical protein